MLFSEPSGCLIACLFNSSCRGSVLERTQGKPVYFTFHLHLEPATYADVLPTYRHVLIVLSADDTDRYGYLF
jgi:hypothetical protein